MKSKATSVTSWSFLAVAVALGCSAKDEQKKDREHGSDTAGGGNAAGGSDPISTDAGMGGVAGAEPSSSAGASADAGTGGDDANQAGSNGEAGSGADGEGGEGGEGGELGPRAILWSDGFEAGFGDWSVEGGEWAIGAPSYQFGPDAHGGTSLAGTVLYGDYNDNKNALLISPELTVPAASKRPRLKYAYWYSFGAKDHGEVLVRVGAGQWQAVAPKLLDQSASWSQGMVDLAPFAGKVVQVGYRLLSDDIEDYRTAGFYIDDVALEIGPMAFASPEGFEQNFGDWSVEGGQWAMGQPSYQFGPAAQEGTKLAGTVLYGDYGTSKDARLITPEFVVPPASQSPRIKYAQWFNFAAGDKGTVEIRVQGGAWAVLVPQLLGSGGSWSPAIVSLAAYAGESVQIAFRLESQVTAGYRMAGWYIDQVSIDTGPQVFPAIEGFEAGFGDWSVEGGQWAIGQPSYQFGPTAATGTNCAGTILYGDYAASSDARLISPELVLPASTVKPRLKYSYWYNFAAGASGQPQIRLVGGEWKDIGAALTSNGASWSPAQLDLKDYVGKTIQVSFRLVSNSSSIYRNAGYYIDDVEYLQD